LIRTRLIVDCDTKFAESFDGVFEAVGVQVKRVEPDAPKKSASPWVEWGQCRRALGCFACGTRQSLPGDANETG